MVPTDLPQLTRESAALRRIDQLGWVAGLCLTAFGVPVGIRTNAPEILDRLGEYLPPGWKRSRSRRVDRLYSLAIGDTGDRRSPWSLNTLCEDEVEIARSEDLDWVLDTLESRLKLHIAETSPNRVFVHAGVAGWKGKAILLPGRSLSGKTTMVAELVRAGADYYSDEYAVLDEEGRVHPYSVPLAVREGNSHRQRKRSVEAYGGRSGVEPLRAVLVLAASYLPGAEWCPRPLSVGQGTLELLSNTVPARREPGRVLDTLKSFSPGVCFYKTERGEARDVVQPILDMIE